MTPLAARDVILGIFKTAWDTTGFPAVYDDLPNNIPTSETVWARATIQHAEGGQSSLAGEAGTRRFTDEGFLSVQVFAPIGDGSLACYSAAALVRDAFRTARNPDVWFRDQKLKEVKNRSGSFQQINVLVTFSYDDVR